MSDIVGEDGHYCDICGEYYDDIQPCQCEDE